MHTMIASVAFLLNHYIRFGVAFVVILSFFSLFYFIVLNSIVLSPIWQRLLSLNSLWWSSIFSFDILVVSRVFVQMLVRELNFDPIWTHMDIIKVLLEMSLWGLFCVCARTNKIVPSCTHHSSCENDFVEDVHFDVHETFFLSPFWSGTYRAFTAYICQIKIDQYQ